MIFIIAFLTAICLYILPSLIKGKQTKEIAVFLGLVLAAFIAGYIYISDPLVQRSIEGILIKAIETKF